MLQLTLRPMSGLHMINSPTVGASSGARALLPSPTHRCLVAWAQTPVVQRNGSSGLRLKRRWPLTQATSDDVDQAQSSVVEGLVDELHLLDETVVQLQEQLNNLQEEEQNDRAILAKLVEDVKSEQCAWHEEVATVEKLMANAGALEASENEVQELQQRYDTLKRKVQLFSGLLQERDREVEALQTQLADVQQLGELKATKKGLAARQKVIAGAAAMEIGGSDVFPGDTTSALFQGRLGTQTSESGPVFNEDNSGQKVSGDSGSSFRVLDMISLKELLKVKGMEAPGVILVVVFLTLSKLIRNTWNAFEQHLPKEVKESVKILAVATVVAGLAMSVSHGI